MKFHIFSNGDVPSRTCQIVHIEVKSCCGYLWQKPLVKNHLHYTDPVWYQPRIVGRDSLERFMKFLAKDLKLSIEYTNHSIHATCTSTLDSAWFKACHIMTLLSHKNESTIKEYSTTCSDIKRKEMFDSLSDAIKPKSPKIPKIKPSATVTKQDDMPTPNPNFDINFDLPKDLVDLADGTLQEIDDFNTIDDEALAHLISDHDNANTNNNNSF